MGTLKLNKNGIFLQTSQNTACQSTIWFHFRQSMAGSLMGRQAGWQKDANGKWLAPCSVTRTHTLG